MPVKRFLLEVTSPSVYTGDAAAEMANGAAQLFDASICVAITGLLGDEPVDGQPGGSLFLATRIDGRTTTTQCRVQGAAPEAIATNAVRLTLEALLAQLCDPAGDATP